MPYTSLQSHVEDRLLHGKVFPFLGSHGGLCALRCAMWDRERDGITSFFLALSELKYTPCNEASSPPDSFKEAGYHYSIGAKLVRSWRETPRTGTNTLDLWVNGLGFLQIHPGPCCVPHFLDQQPILFRQIPSLSQMIWERNFASHQVLAEFSTSWGHFHNFFSFSPLKKYVINLRMSKHMLCCMEVRVIVSQQDLGY